MSPNWTRITIGDKPADVLAPPAPRGVVLFLHPSGEELPSANAASTAAFARHGLAVVAPHGKRAWWADRICAEFAPDRTAERHLLDFVRPWMIQTWGPRAIAAAGISMGGQAAVRLGLKFPDLFPVVAGVASAFDFHDLYGAGTPLDAMYRSREQCRQDTAVLQVRQHPFPRHVWFACDPADDAWFRGNDRLHEKLSAVGIPHTVDFVTTAGGHGWVYFDTMAEPMAQFLATALAAEGRRLV